MRLSPLLVLVVACSSGAEPGAAPSGRPRPAPLPAPPPPVIQESVDPPRDVVIGRYRATLRPRAGRLELAAVAGRASFDFAAGVTSWTTCSGDAPCLPPPGGLALYTDQNQVTFVDAQSGECISNGVVVDCATLHPACKQENTFCGPIHVISNVTHGGARGALPNVVVQLAQENNLANAVQGCFTDADARFGHCGNNGRVDAPTSNLSSPIPGDPSGAPATLACSYCFGNAWWADRTGNPGLVNAVVSGLDGALGEINRDHFALQLAGGEDFGVDITVHAARPAFDAPGTQVQIVDESFTSMACGVPGVSTVFVNGAGFGPPGACLVAGAPSCPGSGVPGAGYTVELEGATGGTVSVPGVSWSDQQLVFVLPEGVRAGRVRVTTPLGNVGSADLIPVCANLRAALVAGAARVTGGGITGHVELGHALGRATLTGGTITMRVDTTVMPNP